ncbi:cupin domain-containing protein [Alteribacillus sp. HJP-4]|uniref:cupin domain-containing protein n=1 Tax=Alteribacillus sp. HJP-4 TaxID=2775394 RepID=UPI0035CCCDAA
MIEKKTGSNYNAVDLGKMENLKSHKIEEPVKARGKVFLNELLELTSMEVSVNSFPPHTSMPFHHKHGENEELYIFISGKGQFQVDDETFDIEEGSVVKVAPAGSRIFRNNSDESLYYVCVQAKENSLNKSGVSDGEILEKEIQWPS